MRSRIAASAIDRGYRERLEPLEQAGLLRLPFIPEGVESHYRTFYIVLNSGATARCPDGAPEAERGLGRLPLCAAPQLADGAAFGYRPGDLPITEDLSGRLPAAAVVRRDHGCGAGPGRGSGRGVSSQPPGTSTGCACSFAGVGEATEGAVP